MIGTRGTVSQYKKLDTNLVCARFGSEWVGEVRGEYIKYVEGGMAKHYGSLYSWRGGA